MLSKFFLLGVLFLVYLSAEKKVNFQKDILPILQDRCVSCHRKAYKQKRRGRVKIRKPKGGLQLDDREKAFSFDDGQLFNKKNPTKSLLYMVITLPENHDDVMPPKDGKLTDEQIKTILAWITQGVSWPDKFKTFEYVKKKK